MHVLNIREPMTRLHTNLPAALARPERLIPEDLRLAEEARALWKVVTDDKAAMTRIAKTPMKWVIYRLRKAAERSCPLELLGRIVVWLANAGVSEAKLRMIPQFVSRVIDDCFAGASHRPLAEIDVDEQRIESRENEGTVLRLTRTIDALSPDDLEAEASTNEQEAAINTERARVLRRRARQKRSGVLRPMGAAC